MHPSITVYSSSVFDFVNREFEIETLASDCKFTEGPVWNQEGYYLFSDTTANTIYKIGYGQKKEIFISNSGTGNPDDPDLKAEQSGSNALDYNGNGQLLICRHGSHDIACFDGNKIYSFIQEYNQKPFNSPNDLVVHADGRVYFSDPPYGLKEGRLNPSKFQPLAGVYCYNNGKIELISDRYQYPNGVCLSPDEENLYICSNKPFEKFISVHDTKTNGFLKILAEENSDGIKCDREGNIYLCNKDGIIILNKNGERLALITLETVPSNICWGGKKKNDLFITARENIFLIRNLQKNYEL